MKYVCVSYNPENNLADVGIYSDNLIDRKFTQLGQDFIVYRGQTFPVLFSSEYDNKIRDFATLLRIGYQGLGVTQTEA